MRMLWNHLKGSPSGRRENSNDYPYRLVLGTPQRQWRHPSIQYRERWRYPRRVDRPIYHDICNTCSSEATKGLVTTEYEHRPWTFLTSHARVLIVISQNPNIRARDIAAVTSLTERSTQRIVADLEADGYLSHERIGRRNHYSISTNAMLRHPHEQGVEIGLLLSFFSTAMGDASTKEIQK